MLYPKDVATIETENNSINLVLIMDNERHATLYMDKVISNNHIKINIRKDKNLNRNFEVIINDNPKSFIIQTKRNINNNSSLLKLMDSSLSDYFYLTTGFVHHTGEMRYDPQNSVPVELVYH